MAITAESSCSYRLCIAHTHQIYICYLCLCRTKLPVSRYPIKWTIPPLSPSSTFQIKCVEITHYMHNFTTFKTLWAVGRTIRKPRQLVFRKRFEKCSCPSIVWKFVVISSCKHAFTAWRNKAWKLVYNIHSWLCIQITLFPYLAAPIKSH